MIKTVSAVIPVYNGAKTIERVVSLLSDTLSSGFEDYEIILVNDCSPDNSHQVLRQLTEKHAGKVRYVRLAKNFGEHNAVMCGLRYVRYDCAVILDDDLQNPPEEVCKLIEELNNGVDVVYSYYENKKHGWFRNLGSRFNGWVASFMLSVPKGLYLSSFKAIHSRILPAILQYKGPYPYIDGLIFRSTTSIGKVLCQHNTRECGESNYTLKKLLKLWLNMFTGFSTKPLQIAVLIGLAMSVGSICLAVFFFVSKMTGGIVVVQDIPAGWASLIICLTFLSGIQLCVLGMIGEYLGRLFLTINDMPQFVVKETYGVSKEGQYHTYEQ